MLLTASAIASANAIALRADAAAFGRGLDELLVGLQRRGRARCDEPVGRRACSARPTPDRFSDAIAMQLDSLLGRNIYDRTQVTGVGYHPPNSPTTGRRGRQRRHRVARAAGRRGQPRCQTGMCCRR